MASVERVLPQHVARMWPHVEGFVREVEPHAHGEWTVDQIKADVLTGRLSIVSVVEDGKCIGTVIYSMQNRRNSRTAHIGICAGSGLTTSDNWDQLKRIFILEGATDIEAAMRPATLRLWSRLGFEEKYRIAGVKL